MSVMFLLFGTLVAFFPLGIIGLVIFLVVRGARNARLQAPGQTGQPAVFSVPARILARRSGAQQMTGMQPMAPVWHFATFEFQNGERLELPVSGADFDLLVEGDYGTLTFAGQKYLGFVRDLQTPGVDETGAGFGGTGAGFGGTEAGFGGTGAGFGGTGSGSAGTGATGPGTQAQPPAPVAENRVMTLPPEE